MSIATQKITASSETVAKAIGIAAGIAVVALLIGLGALVLAASARRAALAHA